VSEESYFHYKVCPRFLVNIPYLWWLMLMLFDILEQLKIIYFFKVVTNSYAKFFF